MLPIESAFKVFTGRDGKPLDRGYVYFGQPNQNPITSPIPVYWDEAGTQPAAQPLRTENGYITRAGTPANVFIGVAYSQLVQDNKRRQVFFARNSDDFSIATLVLEFIANLLIPTGSAAIGWIRNAVGAVATSVSKWMERQQHNVFDFMTDAEIADAQSMAAVLDHTAAILAYKAYALGRLPSSMVFPKGHFRHTGIGNCAYSGLSIHGHSHRQTIIECTTALPALLVDAFEPGLTANDATAPYLQAMNVRDITFKGNATTPIIVSVQGVSRSVWKNVFTTDGEPGAGIAFRMQAVQLSSFYNIGCSTNIAPMSSVPYEGLRIAAGTRNGVSVGNSSNNTFVNPYMEGLSIGIRIAGGDQNCFNSGASEANSVYDLLVANGSRYNVLTGVGFESTPVTANISDGGTYTKYINCYANKSVLLQGIGIEVSGGYYHRIEMQPAASRCRVTDVHVRNWESSFPGQGGFIIAGASFAPEWKNIYDTFAGVYLYPYRARTGIVVGASPFQWTNTTGQYVEVVVQSGVVTQFRGLRGGDFWLLPVAIPGRHMVAPNDILETSFSGAPGTIIMSYIPHNGFQG